MNIAIVVSDDYCDYLMVMLTSLFMNNRAHKIHVYVLHDTVTERNQEMLRKLCGEYGNEIHFILVDGEKVGGFKLYKQWTKEVFFKLLLAEALPEELERVLYLDVDIIVQGPLEELYFCDLGEEAAAVAIDMDLEAYTLLGYKVSPTVYGPQYFNSGMMLLNLPQYRKFAPFSRLMELGARYGYDFKAVDQDLLNVALLGKVKFVEPKYNFLTGTPGVFPTDDQERTLRDVAIIHFAGRGPWRCFLPPTNVWWEYAAKTPCYLRLLKAAQSVMEQIYEEKDQKNREVALLQSCFKLLDRGERAGAWLRENGISGIVIYGKGFYGEVCRRFLGAAGITPAGAACRNDKKGGFHGIPDIALDDLKDLPPETLVVVTPIAGTDAIVEELDSRGVNRVMSFEEFIQGLYDEEE